MVGILVLEDRYEEICVTFEGLCLGVNSECNAWRPHEKHAVQRVQFNDSSKLYIECHLVPHREQIPSPLERQII